jgi:hypothetical protein
MAVTISIKYVASSGLGKISITWGPLFSHCVSLRMLSSLNMFNWMGILFLLIPNLLVPLTWGVESIYIVAIVHLLASYYPRLPPPMVFVIFATAESTFVICGRSTAPFVIYRILGV